MPWEIRRKISIAATYLYNVAHRGGRCWRETQDMFMYFVYSFIKLYHKWKLHEDLTSIQYLSYGACGAFFRHSHISLNSPHRPPELPIETFFSIEIIIYHTLFDVLMIFFERFLSQRSMVRSLIEEAVKSRLFEHKLIS